MADINGNTHKKLTLCSLFDGSGGFCLGAILAGIEPIECSEIEPFPILVTRKRLPEVKHYGDVSALSGAELEPVDIITFGSPCQDLSIAGKRAGIHDGERSSLFFQAIRIIKEMREKTNGEYPRYAVWENVCFHGDTFVTCDTGYKRIKDVSIGDRVKTHTGRYMPVVKVHQTQKQDVLKLKVGGSEDLLVTPNHPFFAIKKKYSKKRIVGVTDPEWIPACQLTDKHLVGYRIDTPTLPENFMTEDEAWAVGRWIADGSVDLNKSNPRMFFSIGIGKESEARKHLGNLPYAIYENKPHPTATNFCFTSHEFYAFIADAGRGAGEKKVPAYVFQLPLRLQRAVLEGYISGDGHVRQRGNHIEASAVTASRELAYGIARLIRNVYRVAASISVTRPKPGKINGRELQVNYPSYAVYASLTNKAALSVVDGDIIWQPVRSVEKTDEKTTVYNLSVLEDNTYAANDIIVHNCGAMSSNGGDDFKAVLEAIIGIKEEGIEVPAPKNHRWPKSDVYLGDGWSVAYRVLDAQYWGVPQRRARIYLVADFAGESAGEVLFKSEGLSGYTPQGFCAWQGTACRAEEGAGETGGRADAGGRVLCLNPQGNSGVGITEDKSLALVAHDHGNHPAVLQAAGFSTEHSAQARSIGYGEEVSPTLRAGVVPAAMAIENHPADSRVKIQEDGKVQTLTNRMGTGGGSVPMVAEPITMKIRGGREGGGKGILCQTDKSATLGCNNDQTLFQPDIRAYGVCSKHSHSMMSDNPHSGFYEAKTSRTLDCNGGRPDCSQGGICVVAPEVYDVRFTSDGSKVSRGHVYPTDTARTLSTDKPDPDSNQGGLAIVEPVYSLQGSMIGRADKNGPQGDGVNEDVSFTLNTVDHHAVAAPVEDDATYCATTGSYMTVDKEKAHTLMARDYKDPQIINDPQGNEPTYIVRRLTPVECARLQGFPDWWCSDLAIPDPTDEEITFWTEVWETWRKVSNPDGKPKTEKQIRKWLAKPYTDSAEYKLWGNGLFSGHAYFVLSGIVWATNKEE